MQKFIGSVGASELEEAQIQALSENDSNNVTYAVLIIDFHEATLPAADLNFAAIRRMMRRDVKQGSTIGYVATGASPGFKLFLSVAERVIGTPIRVTDTHQQAIQVARTIINNHKE